MGLPGLCKSHGPIAYDHTWENRPKPMPEDEIVRQTGRTRRRLCATAEKDSLRNDSAAVVIE